MQDTINTENNESTTVVEKTTTEGETISPVKAELEKVKNKETKSEAEKAAFSLKKNAERLKELGGDPVAVLGIKPNSDDNEDEDAPVTVGMLKKIEAEKAQQTAIQLAESTIKDKDDRELAKIYLSTRIIPTGDPQEDLRLALSMVNSVKNQQIAQELSRSNTQSRSHATSSGVPARADGIFEPTPEEAQFMRSFGMTKEDILKARSAEAENNK